MLWRDLKNQHPFLTGVVAAVAVFGKLAGAICVECSLVASQSVPTLPQDMASLVAPFGDLPGGASQWPELGQVRFERFDPSFKAPFWNERDGLVDSPMAPWNLPAAWSSTTPFTQKEFVEHAQGLLKPFFPKSAARSVKDSV